ncbi:hypothetical protein OEZ86_006423 [Tetradesmus obliquus]|nr:hypothetical protein OEZ86_006423 [Tetradesmus obliquus]
MALFPTTRSHSYVRNQRLQYDWSLRGIRWGDFFRYQHWGGILLIIPAAVVAGLSHWTFQQNPTVRQALLYDATISYPIVEKEAVSNALAVAFNWIAFAVAVLVIELGVFWRQHSLTVALAGILHQAWCCAINFVIVVAISETTKSFSGDLRPDFLARCQPAPPEGSPPGGRVSNHISDAAVPLSAVHLGDIASCTNPNLDAVREGRFAFPSGHASNSMSVAWYTVLYLVWSLYLRSDAPYPRRLYWGSSFWGRLVGEVMHALAYGFIVLCLCLSWYIGATRFWDHLHSIADIIGGFVVAVIFTTPFVIKAVGLHTAMRNRIDGDLDSKTAVLSPAGPDDVAAYPNTHNAGVGGNVMQHAAGGNGMQPPLLPVATPPAPHPAAGQWQASHTAAGWQGGAHSPQDVGRHAAQLAGHQLAGNGRQAGVTGSSGDAVLEMPRR